ncbi:hypothetical protein M5689_022322 [Euphorbia peplus]|nr:hypothetical protein M5689_022322 [Euphorbia peplus]
MDEYRSIGNEMLKNGITPNIVSLLNGFKSDIFTYCTLIQGYCAAGFVNDAFNLRDEMMKNGVIPNIITYNALMNGLCKSGNLDRAWRLFNKLDMKGCYFV